MKPTFCSVLCCLLLLACGKKDGDAPSHARSRGNTIKLVSSLPRTGSANAQTTTIVNGIKLALDEVGGKLGEYTIEYEDWDDASAKKGDWDPEVEASNANRAINDPDVMAYIGTYNSGAAKISMPVLNEAGLVMVSPGNTYSGLTKPGMGESGEPEIYRPTGKVSYFRVVPADDIQGRLGALWLSQMGGKSVYVLDDRSLYGKGVADVFVASVGAFGVRLIGREGVDPKAQEYKSVMAKLKDSDPDFVYFGGTTQTNAGQIAKDLVAVGLRANLMIPDGCFEDAFIEAAGVENVERRAFITFGGVPASKLSGKGAEFVQKYQERYKAEPEAYAVYGYMAAKVTLDAIRRAGKRDRAAIRAAVADTKEVDGVLGSWTFDSNGDTTLATMSGNTVTAGKFAFVTVLEGGTPTVSESAATNGPALENASGPRSSLAGRLLQQLILGLTNGMVFALIALGYTMVYGILELINFAHGDLFMLASFLALTLVGLLGLTGASGATLALGLIAIVVLCAVFSAGLNVTVDRLVYKRLRGAPKLAPLVSAIGVSFIFQNIGLFWGGLPMQVFGGGTAAAAPKAFPSLLPSVNLLDSATLSISVKDLVVISSSLIMMAALYVLVRHTKLGKAMRATAQDPTAARLMGIDVDRVIAWTFAIGGALAGFAAVVYSLYINTISYQIGYQNGLYAFTAAVLGGIGNIPGAVLGGIVIGIVRALSDAWIGAQWQPAVLFGILIVILVFRPSGLLGAHTREKV